MANGLYNSFQQKDQFGFPTYYGKNNNYQDYDEGLTDYGYGAPEARGFTPSFSPDANYTSPLGKDQFGFTDYSAGGDTSMLGGNQSKGLFDDLSFADGAKGFADIAGGLGGLYQLYQGDQMLDMRKDQLGLSKQAYYDNKNRRDNFENKSAKAFG